MGNGVSIRFMGHRKDVRKMVKALCQSAGKNVSLDVSREYDNRGNDDSIRVYVTVTVDAACEHAHTGATNLLP